MGPVSAALIAQLTALGPSELPAIRTLLRQLGALLEAWTHVAAFDVGASAEVFERELGDRDARDARLLEFESIALLFLCHPDGEVRADAWQLAEAVRLADELLYDVAVKVHVASSISANPSSSLSSSVMMSSASSVLLPQASGVGFGLATSRSSAALFGSVSGSALFGAPLTPSMARSLAPSEMGLDDMLAGPAQQQIQQPAGPPPAQPGPRLAALLQESCAHLMQAAHATETAHSSHFDLAPSAFDPTMLERYSLINWIYGRTGLVWASCAAEIAHTLNAADRWQPLRRAIEERACAFLPRLLTLIGRDVTTDSTAMHLATFLLALRPERDPDTLGGVAAHASSSSSSAAVASSAAAPVDAPHHSAASRGRSGSLAGAHPALSGADDILGLFSDGANDGPTYLSTEQLLASQSPLIQRERDLNALLFSRDTFSMEKRDLLPALFLALGKFCVLSML